MTARNACNYWDHSGCVGTAWCPPRCPRFVDKEGTPLLVRPYEDGDFASLVRMYDGITSRTMGLPPKGRDRIERWLTGLTEDGWNLIVLDGERVMGHVGVAPATAPDPEFVIFVHDDYQGRGIGSELIRHVIAYAADGSYDAIRLDVQKTNRCAISVYRNVGFEVTEDRATELAMRLSLDELIAERVRRPPGERETGA